MEEKKKKTLSCSYIHNSVFFAPDELRHCCQRFYVNGEMKGDVPIYKINKNQDFSVEKIIKEKKKLDYMINNGIKNDCTGCPYLTYDTWGDINNLTIKHISFEPHSVCSMKCSYCSDTYYGGKKPNYDLQYVLSDLNKNSNLSKDIILSWGGGEPLLLENFDNVFADYTDSLQPSKNMVFTNAIKFSSKLAEYLKSNKATMTTSLDAGTIETFKKVRGVKGIYKVFENLQKYSEISNNKNIILKYIITRNNHSLEELKSCCDLIKKYKLTKCDLQISADFTIEKLDNSMFSNAIDFFQMLKSIGMEKIFFDYHLRPRIQKYIAENINTSEKLKNTLYKIDELKKDEKFIVWGAGYSLIMMLKNKSFFKKHSSKINYIVDRDINKQNKKIKNFEVKDPNQIKKDKSKIFISSSAYYSEIYDQIISMGINKKRIMSQLFF